MHSTTGSAILPSTPAYVLLQPCHLRFQVTQPGNGPELGPSGSRCAEPRTTVLSGLTEAALCQARGHGHADTRQLPRRRLSATCQVLCPAVGASHTGHLRPGQTGQDASCRPRPGPTRLGAGGQAAPLHRSSQLKALLRPTLDPGPGGPGLGPRMGPC